MHPSTTPRPDALRRLARTVDRWDRELTRTIADARSPAVIERGLPMLTHAADYSVLWMTLSTAMAASGRSDLRRAAARGLCSLALTSLLANQIAKRVVPRQRPLLSAIPLRRQGHRTPTSSSFPSGHTSSAAAFWVGASFEAPWLTVPLGVLAGAVGFSRIYTGAHFTSDVVAGAALGAGIAAAGTVLVPGRQEPSRPGSEPKRPQPPRPDGAGLIAVVNTSSGSVDEELLATLTAELPAAEIVELHDGDDIRAQLHKAAARAEVLGVAGGDGTINCAASVAMDADLPLLVIPGGTFNHFARDLDLQTVAEAIEALRAGRAVRIDVGDLNGEPFLNTASLGSYPEFVRVRESLEDRLGKRVAAAVATAQVLRTGPGMDAVIDGEPRHIALLFVGNGQYRPKGFAPRWRPALDSARLDVRWTDGRPVTSLLLAALTGNMFRSRSYTERSVTSLDVQISERECSLARDGEVSDAPGTVRFSVRRQALTVYRGVPSATFRRRRFARRRPPA